MRSLFRRKRKKKEADNETTVIPPYAGLGVFSPALKGESSAPAHECKRLAELESIFIRSKRLDSLNDVPYIVDQVRNGNIILLDITRMNDGKEQSHLELKRIIERIRGETRSYSADLALVNDNCVIVTPWFVKY